jgi:2-polyprenyl-3-methyl-5-hydroxy-6-metoxy-1,4-benzoquinol methylase
LWYHKVNFGGYSTKSKGWDMLEYLKSYYPIDLVKDKKVLDLGCADGMGSVCLEKSGAEVVAVDLFDISLNHANLVKRYFNCNFKIEKADALGDLSHLGKFDILFCSNLICHVSELNKINPISKKEWLEKIKDIAPIMIFATNDNKEDVPILKKFGFEPYSQYVSQDNQKIYVMLKK